ncbi:MAG TPA: ATP-grasp domain-containing protein [Bryobacteraceae bacterium]|nr:ATP-grasp domain-containing protein [Bryobacteraceae bacterium]
MAMAFRESGCSVTALCPSRGHSLPLTTAVQSWFNYIGLDPLGSLRRAISSSKPHVIIPCDDTAVQHLHELYSVVSASNDTFHRQIALLIERSIGFPPHYSATVTRYEVMRIASTLGLAVPDTAIVRQTADLDVFQRRQPFPWVLKLDGTWGGSGVKIVRNINEARDEFRKMSAPLGAISALKRWLINQDPYWFRPWLRRARPAVIVQSHIDGRPANSAIACVGGKSIAGIGVEVIGALSITGCSSVVRVIENRQMMDASEKLAAKLQTSGFHGFDFMIENSTGVAYLIEMNPRCTPICHLQLGPGHDLVGAFCAEISGAQPNWRPQTTELNTIAYFPKAWHWNPKSELLRTSFHDVPWEEPALLADLIRLPWPDRSFLAQLYNRARHLTFEGHAADGVLFSAGSDPVQPEMPFCKPAFIAGYKPEFEEGRGPSVRAS